MKEEEIRKHAVCDYCNKKEVGAATMGFLGFITIVRKTWQINHNAITRQPGLGLIISAPLAIVIGSDKDMAKMIEEETTSMCLDCYAEKFPDKFQEES